MKIRNVRIYPIAVPRRTGFVNQHVIVRLEAGDGYVGWGEMSDLSHLPLYQFDLPELERSLNELLVGHDARNIANIEGITQRFFPNEGHKYSRSGLVRQGIDLALHDLLGRVAEVPVYELLGGKLRDKIKVCYPVFRMRSTDEVEANLERVQDVVDRGFDLIRVYVGGNIDADSMFLEKFADRFAGDVKIKSLDFSNILGWRDSLLAAERFSDLVDFTMVESIALDCDYDGMVEFRRRGRFPVSEHVNHLNHAWLMLHRGCVDILNVSPYVIGGIRPSLQIIGLAEAAQAGVLIGTTQELNLGTAAAAHLGAVARVLNYASDTTGPEVYTERVVAEPVRYENGYLLVPEGNGLGVEVDEDRLHALSAEASQTFGTNLIGLLDRTAGAVRKRDASSSGET
jgi:galactarate dehydratase (D-threo-forming)